MTRLPRAATAWMAGMALAVAAPVFAQQGQPAAEAGGQARIYNGLFGGNAGPAPTQTLDASLSFAGAADQVPVDANGAPVLDGSASGQWQSMAFATVDYNRVTRRLQISGNLSTSARAANGFDTITRGSQVASTAISTTLGGTRLSAHHTSTYQPAYYYGAFPAAGTAPAMAFVPRMDVDGGGPGATVGDLNSVSHAFFAGITQNITPRLSLLASGTSQITRVESATDSQHLLSYSTGVRYSQPLSRNASLRLGYVYRAAQYDTGAPTVVAHDIDVGVDYSRPLSISRRTRVRFSTGSTVLSTPIDAVVAPPPTDPAAVPTTTTRQQFHYTLTGSAELTHEIARSWNARGSYNRGLGFRRGFSGPVLSDDIAVNVTGLLTRRLDVAVNGTYSNGSINANGGDANALVSYSGSAQLRIALSRLVASFVEYAYSGYEFGQGARIPGVTSTFTNRGVRVGVSLWAPLWRH